MAITYSAIFTLFHDELSVLNRCKCNQHSNSGDVVQLIKCDIHAPY